MFNIDLKKPVIVFGSTGSLGSAIASHLESLDCQIIRFTRENFSVDDSVDALENILKKIKPGLLINCIAMLGLDRCAAEREEALEVNANGNLKILLASQFENIPIIQFSTDSVFSQRTKNQLPNEDSKAYPTTWYGISKYLGEIFVQNKALIVRIPMLFGPSNENQLIGKLIKSANSNQDVHVSVDIYSTITYIPDVANWIGELIFGEHQFSGSIIHLASDKQVSIYECLENILSKMNLVDRLKPVKSNFFQSIEQKPHYGGLASKFTKVFSYDKSIDLYTEWANKNLL